MAVTIACKHKCSCVRVIEITICFVLVTMRDLVDETRTQNSLFPGRKPNSFGNKDLYMYSTSWKYSSWCFVYIFKVTRNSVIKFWNVYQIFNRNMLTPPYWKFKTFAWANLITCYHIQNGWIMPTSYNRETSDERNVNVHAANL